MLQATLSVIASLAMLGLAPASNQNDDGAPKIDVPSAIFPLTILLDYVGKGPPDDELIATAICQALSRLGRNGRAQHVKYFSDKRPAIRTAAILGCPGEAEGRYCIRPLIGLLDDPETRIRELAARRLEMIDIISDRSFDRLKTAAEAERDGKVKHAINMAILRHSKYR